MTNNHKNHVYIKRMHIKLNSKKLTYDVIFVVNVGKLKSHFGFDVKHNHLIKRNLVEEKQNKNQHNII